MEDNAILERVKKNLIIDFSDDDGIICAYIAAAISYAESYQHLERDYYKTNEMSETTTQGVVMLASHFYESRDGSTAGFFANSPQAAAEVWNTVNRLLILDRDWKV